MEEEKKEVRKPKVICFYRERDDYGEFSNFYQAPIVLDGVEWPTSEHYFQAMKFPSRPDYQEKIRTTDSCSTAKAMGQDPDGFLDDWASVKDDVMYTALLAKFT